MKCSMQSDKVACRKAVRRLEQIFSRYYRLDVDSTTTKGATKVLASFAVQQTAIDTLADRSVDLPDKPTKIEAADALSLLLVEVPNNLSAARVEEALTLLKSLAT